MEIYHNPRCTKSRQALQLLKDKGANFEVREYLKESLTFDELSILIKKLNISPEQLLRKNEAIYKEHFKGKTLSYDEWIQAMIDYPKLMERPIVVKGNKAVIGRPTEKLLDLL